MLYILKARYARWGLDIGVYSGTSPKRKILVEIFDQSLIVSFEDFALEDTTKTNTNMDSRFSESIVE